MRPISITRPLLTACLLLATLGAQAQQPNAEGSDPGVQEEDVVDEEEVVAEEEEVIAEEKEVVADEASIAEEEEVVAEEEEVVTEAPAGSSDPGAADGAGIPEGMFAPGQEPWRAAPAGQGVLWGRLVDKESGEPALEAQIKVTSTGATVLTDYEGYYRLELAPGNYELEIFYEMYEPEKLSGVAIRAGRVGRQDVQLTPQEGAVEEIVIEDQAENETIAGLALKRQRAVASGDAVGREEIAKTADTNAAQAAQRVVGANIVGGRFVYVRGLGERYSNALLSGFPLPSPEPDRVAVPLDVFPSQVLDSLTIVKVFTPDIPGDFAGGSVQIETRSVPKEPLFQVTLKAGINTQSTFQDRLSATGSSTDWLGFDNGLRSLPPSVPKDYPLTPGAIKPDGSMVRQAELVQPGKDINWERTPHYSGTPVNHSMTVVGGNTWEFKNHQKLGVLGSFTYSRSFEKIDDMVQTQYLPDANDPRGFQEATDYLVDRGNDAVRWGAFGKVSYLPSQNHKFTVSGLHSQLADSTVSFFSGPIEDTMLDYRTTQISWVQRGVSYGILTGEHTFEDLLAAQLEWNLSISRAFRDQPDQRDTAYSNVDTINGPAWGYVQTANSGRSFWASQTEDAYGGRIDWTQPFIKGATELVGKVGGFINTKQRAFGARRFNYNRNVTNPAGGQYFICEGEEYELNCPDKLFQDDNIDSVIQLQESGQTGDVYDAKLNVYATYGLVDVDFSKKLHVVAGPRIEWTEQTLTPYTPAGEVDEDNDADLYSTDVLPAIAMVYSATEKAKARVSYGRTLARPQLRELAPFAFTDYFGGTIQSGNPNLTLTTIDNVDTRFEYWFEAADVAAVSVFYKHFTDPIEVIAFPGGTTNTLSYTNTPGADLIGFEIELRKNLGFLSKPLRPFSLITNFTATRSRVQIDDPGDILTSDTRPLMNQAPWTFNMALDYDTAFGLNARVIYNVSGLTLVQVGTAGLADAYQHPIHGLDVALSQEFLEKWKAQLQLQNLLNSPVIISQGKEASDDRLMTRYTTGTVISLSLGYEL